MQTNQVLHKQSCRGRTCQTKRFVYVQGFIVDGAQNDAFLAAAHALHICCLGPGIYWAGFYLDIKRPWH